MNYVRPVNLNKSLSTDGQPLDEVALIADRQNLVDRFNAVIGLPGAVVAQMQKDFVNGRMPFQEMVSYVRYCEYMIQAGQAERRSPLG